MVKIPNGVTVASNDVSIDNASMSSPAKDTLLLNGHNIKYSDDFTSFECTRCDESFEVPEIFQQSSDFRCRLYQLYVLARFRNNECPKPTVPIWDQTGNIYRISTPSGNIVTDGDGVMQSTDSSYEPGDMLTDKEWMDLKSKHQKI